MNNPGGASAVPLTVFGGLVTEMSPEDLPEGASPVNQDMDFSPGKTKTRGGRLSQYYFSQFFSQKAAQFGQSVSDGPGETPWTNPNNIALVTPGTYAQVKLNQPSVSQPGLLGLEHDGGATTGHSNALTSNPLTADNPPQLAILLGASGQSITPGAGWTVPFSIGQFSYQLVSNQTPVTGTAVVGAIADWAADILLYNIAGNAAPTFVQKSSSISGFLSSGDTIFTFTNPITAGNSVFVLFMTSSSAPVAFSAADLPGDTFALQTSFANGASCGMRLLLASNMVGGNSQITLHNPSGGAIGGFFVCIEVQGGILGPATGGLSEQLEASNFGLSIPSTQAVLGLQVVVSGHQNSADPSATLAVKLLNNPGGPTYNIQLPAVDGPVTVATPVSNWGLTLSGDLVNNPNLTVEIQASSGVAATFDVYKVELKAWLTPNPTVNFDWVESYEQTDGELETLALDAAGILWKEDVINAPGTLTEIYNNILPNSFAHGETFDDIKYFGISDLNQGTDVPRLWDGDNLRRVSQVGPGAAPQFAGVAVGSPIVSVAQNAAQNPPTSSGGTSGSWLLWSAGPTSTGSFGSPATPGNVLTIIFPKSYTMPKYITVGSNVVLKGMQVMNGTDLNSGALNNGVPNPAFYTVTSVGTPNPSQDYYDGFTVTVSQTGFYNARVQAGFNYQSTLATASTSTQVPGLEVGQQMQIEGNSQTGYNNTWTVQQTPNASTLKITNTSLTNGVATYAFTLVTGSAPTPGEFLNVTGTNNGNGAFNVKNAVINTVAGSTLTVALPGPDVAGAGENGNGFIYGTQFVFDPAGIVANPIIGSGSGGTIAAAGVVVPGKRRCVCMFETDTGFRTPASPYLEVTVAGSNGSINVSQIPVGGPEVKRRVLAFTAAEGSNFYVIEQPVKVTVNGQQVTYDSTVINDNTTTQVNLSFPDTVLTSGTQIDIQGNNLFNEMELGSCMGFVSYASRLFAIGEQNKVQNFLNWSFDGGIGVASAQLQTLGSPVLSTPLGWTVDPVNGGGGQLVVSPIYGNAYYVKNSSGGLAATLGQISQPAYLDQYGVPIIRAQTTYSVRLAASCPSQIGSGSLVVDLFSPSANQVYGSFSVPLAGMASSMQIFTGTLLTAPFGIVPNDLQLRVYGQNVPNNGDFELDRVEVFPTKEPVFSTQLRGSYANNPQAFDLVTGACGPDQNQQPLYGAFRLFDNLYALKRASSFQTADNGVTEPNQWQWKTVSDKIGTAGIHAYDYGENWAVTACRPGVYFFNGGEPIKMSQEFQTVWDMVDWTNYGQTVWCRNDVINRRILVGIPLATGPNAPSFPYLPEFPANASPTSPNVVIAINYRELNTGMAVAEVGPIKSTFSGRILSPEPARKPSPWNIRAPYGAMINRGGRAESMFLCNGYANSKIYALDDHSDDDGTAINGYYITYGFVKADMADAKGLGLYTMITKYLTALVVGSGNLNTYIYPNTPQNDLPLVLDPFPLDPIAYGDLEIGPADGLEANRYFVRFGTNALGARFQLSKIVLALAPSPMASVRGTLKGTQ